MSGTNKLAGIKPDQVPDFTSFDDLLDLPHHVSSVHPPMTREERAAQFSAFRALTGHEQAIRETARLTDRPPELSEGEAALLNAQLQTLQAHLRERPAVTVTWFQPDEKKAGGRCRTTSGTLRRLDLAEGFLHLHGGERIPLRSVIALESELEPAFTRLNGV